MSVTKEQKKAIIRKLTRLLNDNIDKMQEFSNGLERSSLESQKVSLRNGILHYKNQNFKIVEGLGNVFLGFPPPQEKEINF